jgi:hypothetical protein
MPQPVEVSTVWRKVYFAAAAVDLKQAIIIAGVAAAGVCRCTHLKYGDQLSKKANAQMRAQDSGSYCGRSYTRQQYSHYVRRSSLSAPVLSVACAAAPPGAGGPPTAHDTAAPQQEWSQTSPPVGTP